MRTYASNPGGTRGRTDSANPRRPTTTQLARLQCGAGVRGIACETLCLVDELPGGIRRLTFSLPMGPRHVHCYLLPGDDGWTLVDTGLGLPSPDERWGPVLRE